ncbi:MAG: hypothetical protein GY714_03325 [Desulfobacterales bacterium]|nr:hypothetical protein [Desulfobacterales bacterium]
MKEKNKVMKNEKKRYTTPVIEEHDTLEKVSACSLSAVSYNSDTNTYYH